jgi:CarD family transcriptional regulator
VRGPPPRHPDEPKAELSSLEGTIADAADLTPGTRVVYPNQGVCEVVGAEVQEIAGQRLEMVRMRRVEDGATVLVPRTKVASVGLRRVATRAYVEGVFHYLAAPTDDPELDWKIRHRDNADRLVGGGVLGVAEVVKGLHALARLRPLPTKEREQYDGSRHLLVAEVSAALGVSASVAEDYVDHALMPPAGTTFKLKPPPTPVELPVRLARRRPVAKSEDDISLDELGLELEGIAEIAEGGDDGEEKAEGEKAEGEAGDGAEAGEGAGDAAGDEPAAAPEPEAGRKKARAEPAAKAKKEPAPKKARAEKPEKAATRAEPEKKPAKKAKAEKPVKAPAKKPAARKPAAKKPAGHGGKK